MCKDGKKLDNNQLEQVTGGYLNLPQDSNGNYICPYCKGAIDSVSLVCSGCGKSYGKSGVDETRKFE